MMSLLTFSLLTEAPGVLSLAFLSTTTANTHIVETHVHAGENQGKNKVKTETEHQE